MLTWKDGIGQYLDDPRVQELAKRLCKKYAQKLYNPLNTEKNKPKSADKIKPRFKVGDWVVNKFGDSWHIDSLDKKNYQVSDGEGNYNYFPMSKQDEIHLWTVQDAKDGDIICYRDEISLYKNEIENCNKQDTTFGGFVYYCCYDGKSKPIKDNVIEEWIFGDFIGFLPPDYFPEIQWSVAEPTKKFKLVLDK